jgi:hypothetical protein
MYLFSLFHGVDLPQMLNLNNSVHTRLTYLSG